MQLEYLTAGTLVLCHEGCGHHSWKKPIIYDGYFRKVCMDLTDFKEYFMNWENLSQRQRSFFLGEEYLPFHKNVCSRIDALPKQYSKLFYQFALKDMPGFAETNSKKFTKRERILLQNVWNKKAETQKVRDWLHNRGIPFSQIVYLLYDDTVIRTEWKIFVKYWEAFAWSVGMSLLILDLTNQWLCEVHHEEIIAFYSYSTEK